MQDLAGRTRLNLEFCFFLLKSNSFFSKGALVKDLCKFLEKENVTYRIKLDNIQKSVDEEMRHIEEDEGEFTFRFGGGPTDSRSEFNLFNYHPLEKIYDFVTQVNPLLF